MESREDSYDLRELHQHSQIGERWSPLDPAHAPDRGSSPSPVSTLSATLRPAVDSDHHRPVSPYAPSEDEIPFTSVGLGISSASGHPSHTQHHHLLSPDPSFVSSQESPRRPGVPGPQRRHLSQESSFNSQDSPGSFPDTPGLPYRSHDFLLGDHHDTEYPPQTPLTGQKPEQANGQRHEPPSGPPPATARWSWFWTWADSAWVMYELLLVGIVLAVSHHVFYSRLDKTPADDQLKMLRYGNMLAYATKSFLASAIIFAYRQQIWATVRRKNLQLGTIDSLFAAVDDIRAMVNLEFITQTKVALGLAIVVWLFPLTVILTPATLTVSPLLETIPSQCSSVRTLNFDLEKSKNWRKRDLIDGYPELSLSLWNCTQAMSADNFSPFNETFFDYWTSSSWQTALVATLSAYSGKVVPRENVSVETCGEGWDCQYNITFVGPGYKCDEIARGRDDNTQKLATINAPFTTNDLLPDGDFGYLAHATLGDYSSVQIDADPGGMPKMDPPYPPDLGAFRTEPVLWIGHSDLTNTSHPAPEVRTASNWNTSFTPVIFRCEHYVVNYTVQFSHTQSTQTTTVLNRSYLHPVINTTYIPHIDANDGTKDNITATPKANYIHPLDVDAYRLTAAYHSLGSQLRAHINGSIQHTPYIVAITEAMKTRLIDKTSYLVSSPPNTSFQDELQKFYENMLLSLLSNPQFLAVAWASKPHERSGRGNATSASDSSLHYPCIRSRVISAYNYKARDLWIVYSLAIALACVGVGLGAVALGENNHRVRDTRVSSIVAATRARCLDELPWRKGTTGTAQATATPKKEPATNTSPSRSPSPSSPPGPLEERFMIEGVDHDDRYRMVEDEFLAVAVQFTKHIHKAEYQRLKALAESQNADTIRDISRPVTGEMTADVKRRQTALGNAAKQRKALASVLGKRSAGHTSDSDDDGGRPATSLQGLMKSKHREPVLLTAVSSAARATLGLDAGPSRYARPPSTSLQKRPSTAAASKARGNSSVNGFPPSGRNIHQILASNSDDEELIDLKQEEILRIKQEQLTDSGEDEDEDDDDLDNQVSWSPRYRHKQAPKKPKPSLPERSAPAKPPAPKPKSDPRPSASNNSAPKTNSRPEPDSNSNSNAESDEEDPMASIRARIAARKQNQAHPKPQQKDKAKESPPRTTTSSLENRKTSLDEIPFI
ncbi:hypothetical protein B0T19DRAFT_443338 [Cercophora scortea]|uniref:Uncharacterized protein n=1 Tax=Cercophora scortea TaxID=314031 RepID=A0AAE0IF75_9PEZI|nr:hypothetical protein B0T19DRAFT_443338 [Cercophora scortea]